MIPGWGKILWRRKWQPPPVFLPENPMDRGAWWTTVHEFTKSEQLSISMKRLILGNKRYCYLYNVTNYLCLSDTMISILSYLMSPFCFVLHFLIISEVEYFLIHMFVIYVLICKERSFAYLFWWTWCSKVLVKDNLNTAFFLSLKIQ